MTHHNEDDNKDSNKRDVEKSGKSEVIKEDKIDFGKDVKQAVTELPNPAKGASVPVSEVTEVDTKKNSKAVSEIKKYEDQIGCGFCGVSISKGGLGTIANIKGKKFKKVDGKYNVHSPGADDGTVRGVLCEAHAKSADQLPEGVIDFKTAVAIGPDGVQNVDIRSL